jgi:predicted adenine nucleotide alpha hydrolase (AANH) superfamily ATPase
VRLLLHCCCGPCAVEVADHFRTLGDEVVGWFFNPNIYPEAERRLREQTLAEAAARIEMPLLSAGPGMTLEEFLAVLVPPRAESRSGVRCAACYQLRLEATAREAAASRCEAFSTTLLISPYQDMEAIREAGLRAGERHGVVFRFEDLRERYPDSCRRSRAMGLYRQNYCGCLFSALERAERRSRRAIAKISKQKAA